MLMHMASSQTSVDLEGTPSADSKQATLGNVKRIGGVECGVGLQWAEGAHVPDFDLAICTCRSQISPSHVHCQCPNWSLLAHLFQSYGPCRDGVRLACIRCWPATLTSKVVQEWGLPVKMQTHLFHLISV